MIAKQLTIVSDQPYDPSSRYVKPPSGTYPNTNSQYYPDGPLYGSASERYENYRFVGSKFHNTQFNDI